MAVPKGKVSKQRRNKRRSSVWKLAAPTLVACAKCGALHLPHRMCPECGSYNGREVKVVSLWPRNKFCCAFARGKHRFPLVFYCSHTFCHGKYQNPSFYFMLVGGYTILCLRLTSKNGIMS